MAGERAKEAGKAAEKASKDVSDKIRQQSQAPDQLNSEVEVMCKANAFTNPIFPKPGYLMLGDKGIEFVASGGVGFAQIPWPNVSLVRADIYGKYVRSIEVVTDEAQTLPFVISNGAEVLRCVRDHIGRDKMSAGGQQWSRAAKNDKSKLGSLFHHGKADAPSTEGETDGPSTDED
ncbi:MAG: DUF956 family protein [Atopobiaceae bacterium]|nr:DUF956 family protein [Atopobiaceae bacterium]MCI2207408.1 DUF956 family protein [Atopobiaceae bacterium]